MGREFIWGVFPPHTLLPKEEKEEKIVADYVLLQKECRKMTLSFLLIMPDRNIFKILICYNEAKTTDN